MRYEATTTTTKQKHSSKCHCIQNDDIDRDCWWWGRRQAHLTVMADSLID